MLSSFQKTSRFLLAFLGLFLCFTLLAALPLQAMAAATPATSEEAVQDVVAQLGTLQRAHIDPAWQPDIEANQALVQAMLTSFTSLTTAQRSQLTASQKDDLLSYFTALYRIQGKTASAAAALFEVTGTSQSTSSSGSSSRNASSSRSSAGSSSKSTSVQSTPASRPPSSQSAAASPSSSHSASANSTSPVSASSGAHSSSLSSAFSTPANAISSGSASSSALATAAFPPQIPGASGPFSFLGSAAFGRLLTVLLVALLAVLVLRFLFAMRTAGPAPDTRRAKRAEQKNLPQQNEDTALLAALPHTETLHPDFQLSESLTPAERRAQKRQLRAQKKQQRNSTTAADLTAHLSAESTPTEEASWVSHNPINPAEMDAIAQMFTAPSSQEADKNPLGIVLTPEATPKSKGARTGKPGRIRFSQGDPRDLDAIDD